jgi:hypothetical protein
MKTQTMSQLSLAIQMLRLDGFDEFSKIQLANASGLSRKTIQHNAEIIEIIDFALRIHRSN